MTKLLSLFVVSIALVSTPVLGAFRDIQEVCDQTPDIKLFGKFLRQNPDIYAFYAAQKDTTFYIPSDEAFEARYGTNSSTLRRRATAQETADSQQMAANGINNINKQRRLLDQKDSSKTVTGGSPSGKAKRQLQSNTTQSNTGVSVSSGLGKTSNILFGDIQCTQGLVQVVDSWFTHPEPVTDTLQYSGQTKFLNSVNAAGLADKYNTLGQITVFAPVDSAFKNQSTLSAASVQNHVIEGTALYSPNITDGYVYSTPQGNIYFTVLNSTGQYFANCVELIQIDSIVENGVIHSADGIITLLSAPPPCVKSSTVQPYTGAGSVGKAVSTIALIGAVFSVIGLVI